MKITFPVIILASVFFPSMLSVLDGKDNAMAAEHSDTHPQPFPMNGEIKRQRPTHASIVLSGGLVYQSIPETSRTECENWEVAQLTIVQGIRDGSFVRGDTNAQCSTLTGVVLQENSKSCQRFYGKVFFSSDLL